MNTTKLGEAPVLPITITNGGGERLYIHPIAVEVGRYGALTSNKINILYLTTGEFRPNPSDYSCLDEGLLFRVVTEHNPIYTLVKRLWYLYIKRLIVSIKLAWSYKTSGLGWWKYIGPIYSCTFPVIANDIYEHQLAGFNQLVVQDKENLVEDYYMNPSQKWLTQQVDEWVNKKYPEHDNYHHRYQEHYKEWRDKQLKAGREIIFLCSLDT